MFVGYFKNEKATRETIDPEGYVHSGDLGKIDEDGFLQITGRIKELIITAGGENIAPVLIEDKFKEHCSVCSNIQIIGDDRKYLSAIISLKVDVDVTKNGKPSKNLTQDTQQFLHANANSTAKTTDEAVSDPNIAAYIQKCIDETNKSLISRAHHIRKWKLITVDFSIDGNELTPTMKLKRKVVENKYKDLIESMYQDPKL